MERVKTQRAEAIFRKVLAEIKPGQQELKESTKHVNSIMDLLSEIVARNVELHVAGSIARGTNLRGAADVDIFMLFPMGMNKKSLEEKGLGYGKELAKRLKGTFEIKYAEHPYVRVYSDLLNARVDIVPAFKIDNIEQMGTAVDRTPLHTRFINSNFTDRQRDDTRLLKYMMRSHGIYGAEVRTNGFSGYLCELLVLNYGSLLKLLEDMAYLKLPAVLTPDGGKDAIGRDEALKRFNSEFIVVDPVDRNRNVAAGVSMEALGKFVTVAREFVSDPSLSTFSGRHRHSKWNGLGRFLKDSALEIFTIEIAIPEKSDDVVFPQLRKTANIIAEEAERFGFPIYMIVPFISGRKGYMAFIAPHADLKTRLMKGPDVFAHSATTRFIAAHRNCFGFVIRDNHVYALDRNRYGSLEAMLGLAAKGRVVRPRNDIRFGNSRLHVGRLPKGVEGLAGTEISKKLGL